ncbi:MAG: enoyl-CoA hydratase/isomerase family protein [Deltaproteobacteria bacterium]|nr:enoyl-CoA hydratase/isomerase family protein [Deltaproteobacteria bacterium]
MSCIIYEKTDEVIRISFNRPEKLNAVNDDLLKEFDSALKEAEGDDTVTAVVIKGSGTSFCAGYDIGGKGTSETGFDFRSSGDVAELMEQQWRRQKSIFNLARFPKSTIAHVQGYCLEIGCSFAMACDISFADEKAKFGDPSVRMGLTTDMPLWYHLVTHRKAKELLFTGKIIDGIEAERIGIITKAVPADQLDQEVNEMALTVSLTPFDGLTNNLEGYKTGTDARSLAAGWRSSADKRAFGILQRPGTRSGEFNFLDVRDKKGLKAALAEMNAPYKKLGY